MQKGARWSVTRLLITPSVPTSLCSERFNVQLVAYGAQRGSGWVNVADQMTFAI